MHTLHIIYLIENLMQHFQPNPIAHLCTLSFDISFFFFSFLFTRFAHVKQKLISIQMHICRMASFWTLWMLICAAEMWFLLWTNQRPRKKNCPKIASVCISLSEHIYDKIILHFISSFFCLHWTIFFCLLVDDVFHFYEVNIWKI